MNGLARRTWTIAIWPEDIWGKVFEYQILANSVAKDNETGLLHFYDESGRTVAAFYPSRIMFFLHDNHCSEKKKENPDCVLVMEGNNGKNNTEET